MNYNKSFGYRTIARTSDFPSILAKENELSSLHGLNTNQPIPTSTDNLRRARSPIASNFWSPIEKPQHGWQDQIYNPTNNRSSFEKSTINVINDSSLSVGYIPQRESYQNPSESVYAMNLSFPDHLALNSNNALDNRVSSTFTDLVLNETDSMNRRSSAITNNTETSSVSSQDSYSVNTTIPGGKGSGDNPRRNKVSWSNKVKVKGGNQVTEKSIQDQSSYDADDAADDLSEEYEEPFKQNAKLSSEVRQEIKNLKSQMSMSYAASGDLFGRSLRTGKTNKRGKGVALYLITTDGMSWRRPNTDVIFFWHKGTPINIHTIDEKGRYSCVTLGDPLITAGACFSLLLQNDCWHTCHQVDENCYTLISVTASSGINPEWTIGDEITLKKKFPNMKDIISKCATE